MAEVLKVLGSLLALQQADMKSRRESSGVGSAPCGAEPGDGEAKPESAVTVAPHLAGDPLPGLEGILGELKSLREDFEKKLMYDGHKNVLIDELHSELQTYKADIIWKMMQPLLLGIVKLSDQIRGDLGKLRQPSSDLEKEKAIDVVKAISVVAYVPEMMEELLFRQGVTSFASSEGDALNARRHKVTGPVEETSDEAKNRTVRESVRPGYEFEGKLLTEEIVRAYLYKPQTPPPAAAEPEAVPSSAPGGLVGQ
ncbi:MAG: nucleotide exchange factor GrpE [Synergistaceae bacterium]|nr:nucleotide exchange factor GrpE [Synergistaceae bacterium]